MGTIRVIVADDQPLVRAGVAGMIDSQEDLEVGAHAFTGLEAVTAARTHLADVVVMDIRMPDMDGIEATRQICADEDLAGVRVLILTTFETDRNVLEALAAGASGFLGKDAAPADLLHAVRVVAAGDELLSPAATKALIHQYRNPAARQDDTKLRWLTDREREVLALVGAGLSNDEIATRLFITPLTAKTHVNRVMTKLDAHDRAGLVIAAYESGLVS